MKLDKYSRFWDREYTLVGVVHGGLNLWCGVENVPSIFARVQDGKTLEFIHRTIGTPGWG